MSPTISRPVEWIVYAREGGRRLGKVRRTATGFLVFRVLLGDDEAFTSTSRVYVSRREASDSLLPVKP